MRKYRIKPNLEDYIDIIEVVETDVETNADLMEARRLLNKSHARTGIYLKELTGRLPAYVEKNPEILKIYRELTEE